MARVDSADVFFHRAKLADVCRGLVEAGRSYLVLGPPGIGKSAFLRNVESYGRSTIAAQDKKIEFRYVDFVRQPLGTDEAQQFKEELLNDLRGCEQNKEQVTFYLMDHIQAAISRPDVYGLDFFDTLGICARWRNLSFVIASEELLRDQLYEAYPDAERSSLYKLPAFNTHRLGLVPIEEANTFIIEAGGHKHWKAEMPWLTEHTEAIRKIAGRYPVFLERAIEELYGIFGGKQDFDREEFHSRFLERMSDRYRSLWESLDEEEKALLFRLSEDGAPSRAEQAVLERLRTKALITHDYRVFSTAFQQFVSEHTEYAPVPWRQKLLNILWPLAWTREQTAYAMLALLLLYAVVIPMIRVAENSFRWMLVSLVVFMIVFIVLLALYWRDSNREPADV